jgi:hypothetical protein
MAYKHGIASEKKTREPGADIRSLCLNLHCFIRSLSDGVRGHTPTPLPPLPLTSPLMVQLKEYTFILFNVNSRLVSMLNDSQENAQRFCLCA